MQGRTVCVYAWGRSTEQHLQQVACQLGLSGRQTRALAGKGCTAAGLNFTNTVVGYQHSSI